MIAIVFELQPAPGKRGDYLDWAAELKPELEKMQGFVSVERFESLTTPGKLLSLSLWEDEAAVERWRNHPMHREAQAAGRGGLFSDYRLRVVSVIRDYGPEDREQAPADAPW